MEAAWRGDGSIKKVEGKTGAKARHNGKFRLQWTIVVDGRPQPIDKLFDKKGDAVAWRDQKKVELRTGVRVEAVKSKARELLTFQAMFDELAGTKENEFRDGKWVKNGSSPQTVRTKLHRWNKNVAGSPIAKRPMRSLTRDDARAHVELMKAKGATIQTIKDTFGVMKMVAFGAIDEKPECRSMANPFQRIAFETDEESALAARDRAMKEATEGPRLVLLTPEAASEGLRKVEDPKRRAMLALHLLAGLRFGERLALCVEQIDVERGVIVVDRSMKLDAKGRQYVGLPKRNKIRLAALSPALARILAAYTETLPAGWKHLFPQERADKTAMAYRDRCEWEAAVKKAGLPPQLLPKGCRASHNNWLEKLCGATVSTSTRLEHMGHSLSRGDGQPSGLAVNLANYTGHIPEAYAALGKAIDGVLDLSLVMVDRGT